MSHIQHQSLLRNEVCTNECISKIYTLLEGVYVIVITQDEYDIIQMYLGYNWLITQNTMLSL